MIDHLLAELRAVGPLGWARILFYVGAALVVVFVGLPALEGLLPGAGHDALVIRNTNAWIKGDHARQASFARLQARSDSYTTLARAANAKAATEHAAFLALAGDLVKATTAADSNPILVRMVVKAQGEIRDLRASNADLWHTHLTDSTTIASVNAALSEAMTNLRATVKVADCRWLNLSFAPKCLSRKASLVVGAALGAGAVLVVSH